MNKGIYFDKELQQDNIFINTELVSLNKLTGYRSRKGLEKAIISEGAIVNIVSDRYGHLSNEDFFLKVEEKLIEEDINYISRSINRDNRAFCVDYILNDDKYHIAVKNGVDTLRPMLRFTNSYDGSCKTSGHFGYFREVCKNGLHLANTKIGFSIKHTGNIANIVLPQISSTVKNFINNEYYELRKKFEVLAERPIKDISEFVKITADNTNLFKYECSDKNDAPSLNARIIKETIAKEAALLNTAPNHWIGYNAFNELLHGKLKRTFGEQKKLDNKIFDAILYS